MHDSPMADSSLAVILYRLDSLDRNLARLTSVETHAALEGRVRRLEQDDEARDAWGRQITAGVILAALSSASVLIVTILGG